MLKLVDYIARRMKEDNINEWDYSLKAENTQSCISYVFEYFNNYLVESTADEKTYLEIEKTEKYKAQITDYDQDTQDWLIMLFEEQGNRMNVIMRNFVKKDKLFLLFNSDSEFRSISYECYSQLIKKYPFLKDHTEMIYEVIKQLHRIETVRRWDESNITISESVDEWIKLTYRKYNVNLFAFAEDWVSHFYDNQNLWPARHKIKSNLEYTNYEYDYRQKDNLFTINDLYRRLPKKAYIKGRKQDLEALMMYLWLHTIEGDHEYWDEYKIRLE